MSTVSTVIKIVLSAIIYKYMCFFMNICPYIHVCLSVSISSVQLAFNVHIPSKLLEHMPVMGTHTSYELGSLSRTEG